MKASLGLANGNIPTDFDAFTGELIAGWVSARITCLAVHFHGQHELVARSGGRLRELLADSGIRFAQYAGVNANFVHYDENVRKRGHESVKRAIDAALALGSPMILSGSGSNSPLHEDHFYGPDKLNYTRDAQDRLIDELSAVAPVVEAAGLSYAIECHQLSVMRSPEVIRRVLDAVDSPHIVANFDPINLLDSAYAAYNSAEHIAAMVDVVGHRYGPTTHVKDMTVTPDLVCRMLEVTPGDGIVDFPALFDAAARIPTDQPMALIVEHLDAARSDQGVRFVREAALAHGIELA